MNDFPSCRDESDGRTAVRSVLERRRELDSSTDWDSVIGAVSKRRRRYLLYLLAEDPVASVEQLADRILALEEEVLDGPDLDRSDVLVSLLHRDVPILEEADLVTFDRDDRTIARGGCFHVALDLLDGAFRSSGEFEA